MKVFLIQKRLFEQIGQTSGFPFTVMVCGSFFLKNFISKCNDYSKSSILVLLTKVEEATDL
jgi:hypothetical protein